MSLPLDQLELLERLRLFDPAWYARANSDVPDDESESWQHFLTTGFAEGRQPGPRFVPEQYLAANPDLVQAGVDPLAHFLGFGYREGRALTPEERELKERTGSRWPESPLPENLPGWYGTRPGPAPQGVVRILAGLSVQQGGTPQTNEDLMIAFEARHSPVAETFVLRCAGDLLELFLYRAGIYVSLERHWLGQEVEPFPHQLDEYDDVVGQWLRDYGISLVHVHHSAWQSLGLMDSAYKLSIPVVYSVHDYYTVCPSVKLLDENQVFCRGRCTPGGGECHQEAWRPEQIGALKHAGVYRWQQQFAGPLALCAGFVTTSALVRDIMLDIFPALADKPFRLIPHGRDFDAFDSLAEAPTPGEPLRVVLPGYVARSKGAGVLLELANNPELVDVQWHVLGTVEDPEIRDQLPANVTVHGPYQVSHFAQRVADIKPHLGAVLSIWPETWCHTLTELWATGVPVLAFDLGAVGERLQQTRAGWLAPEVSASAMAALIQQARQPAEWQQAVDAVSRWQLAGPQTRAGMAEAYWQLYQDIGAFAVERSGPSIK
ncbi:glycosyltransferase [Marinobacter bryozoorum]|uniref:glycosyltransferase n=1 Tax=Marinobacter bryozoorum TaxID=256324 RepID=UPI002004BD15|nr:glycosyltransferase [Marinobacter bryozoorum]MCK7544808.1 glycosyltransferase [Marinobacter bryozoorum]